MCVGTLVSVFLGVYIFIDVCVCNHSWVGEYVTCKCVYLGTGMIRVGGVYACVSMHVGMGVWGSGAWS